jgi:hypothetical protein
MSDADKVQLLRWIIESDWLEIDALIREKHPEMLADVVFSTYEGRVYLTGKAHCLSDDTEAFSLDVDRYPDGGRWKAGSGPNFLTTRNIKEELVVSSMAQLLTLPRTVRFFTDPRFGQRVYPKEVGLIDNCAAIDFAKIVDGTVSRLVIVASNNFPCEIEIGTDPVVCATLLKGLEEIDFL